jgi:hypothetical protein
MNKAEILDFLPTLRPDERQEILDRLCDLQEPMKKLATMVLKQPPARTSARGTVPWTLAEMKQLGRTPDSLLARRSGRTIHEVVAMRESRGIGLVTGPRPLYVLWI